MLYQYVIGVLKNFVFKQDDTKIKKILVYYYLFHIRRILL